MDWIELTEETQLEKIKKDSESKKVVLFKHSTRCGISGTTLDRLERKWKAEDFHGVDTYYLDLLQYRPISTKISNDFYVEHQSPQLLIIKNGRCVYHRSHYEIEYNELVDELKKM
jgi:bacillithiol system protein YtxJ